MPQTLAQMVRAKHPGAYDDLSDEQLESAVTAKYPGTYDDLPRTTATAPPPPSAPAPADLAAVGPRVPVAGRGTNLDVARSGDFAAGLRSTGARTVYGGGDIVRRLTGQERIVERPEVQAAMTAPNNFAGTLGRAVGDAALFGVPLAKVSSAVAAAPLMTRVAAEGAAAAGIAGLQSGGDSTEMGLAAAGGAVLPFAAAGGRMVQRAAAGAKQGGLGGAIASAVRTVAPGEPRAMLVQALKPRSVKVNFTSTLDRALPELKAAEASIGRPIASVDDLLAATKAAKGRIQEQLNVLRGGVKGFEVDLTPVADAMVKSIPKKLQLENAEAALRLKASADAYRQRFSIEDAEALLLETNAELDGFYALMPRAQHSAIVSNPAAAALDAQAKSLRDAIYATLDEPGSGGTARELKRRYGALLEVEGEAYRRANVAARQQPESLSEQIGAVRAAADMARGTWRVLHGDVTGAADIMAAHAGRSTAKAIKDSQTTDALIQRAFAGFSGKATPIVMPMRRPVAGLLNRGPLVTPPPADASFVRSVPAMPSHSVRRALPPAQPPAAPQAPRRVFEMPGDVAPDGSRVGSVPAAPIAYNVDPTVTVKAGGFRVAQFSGDPTAAKAAVAAPETQAMLRRMADDLNTFAPQRGKLVQESLDTSDSHYAYGGAGSPVGDDIRVISEQNVGNVAIQRAIADLLAGKQPTNRLHTAALDAAMGYLEKRPGYRGPSVPASMDGAVDDAAFEAWSRAIDDAGRE